MQDEDKIVNDNIGLVHSCAKRFKYRNLDYDDIFQSGCIGLVKAVRSFDKNRGLQFSTYAVPVILGEIKQLFRNNSSIKVGRKLKDLSIKVKKECEDFLLKHERQPTISELCKKFEVESEKILEALEVSKVPMSLTSHNEDCEDSNNQIDIPIEFDEDKISENILLSEAFESLCDQDKTLIRLRYFKGLTQSKTAKVLNLTQVQVSRKEKRIINILYRKIG